ncbi:hypothetical protein BscR1v2_007150 [Bartonella schoenbuchensis R1]|uniref:Uncharacterized protein n=1 Tax=Bartonella schoenbuchensis (strain DSM 13525 / NCTC 13165 / R1) TaxID=687861 RepID=A0A1S6XPV1_BARSR|nr:hypothetical protein BscR1v2_007150 [Bartonella schoenbuchensis R1]
MTQNTLFPIFPYRHLLGIKGLNVQDLTTLLDRADANITFSKTIDNKKPHCTDVLKLIFSLKPPREHNPHSN